LIYLLKEIQSSSFVAYGPNLGEAANLHETLHTLQKYFILSFFIVIPPTSEGHYKMRAGVRLSVRLSVCRVPLAAAIGCTRTYADCGWRGIPVTQSERWKRIPLKK